MIFDDAKFGDIFETRGGNDVILQRKNTTITGNLYIVFSEYTSYEVNEDGRFVPWSETEFDIIKRKELIYGS